MIDDFVKGKSLKQVIVAALETDGGHHKQWYLEQLLEMLGFDKEAVRREEEKQDYSWEDGIAP